MLSRNARNGWARLCAVAMLMVPGCKPPNGETETKALVGDDSGREVALTVIPMDIVDSVTGAVSAEALRVVSQALVFVRCVESGSTYATDAARSLELKASYGHAVISRSGKIFATTFPSGKIEPSSSCQRVDGTGFISARRVFTHFSDGARAFKPGANLLVSQAVYLALRGPFEKGKAATPTFTFLRFSQMAAKELGLGLDPAKSESMFKTLDAKLNPCVNAAARSYFACAQDLKVANSFNYKIDTAKESLDGVAGLMRDFFAAKDSGFSLQEGAFGADDGGMGGGVPEQSFAPTYTQDDVMTSLNTDAQVYYQADQGLPQAQSNLDGLGGNYLDTSSQNLFSPGSAESVQGNRDRFSEVHGMYQADVQQRQAFIAENARDPANPLAAYNTGNADVQRFWSVAANGGNTGAGADAALQSKGYDFEGVTPGGQAVYRAPSGINPKEDRGYIFYDQANGSAERLVPNGYTKWDTTDGRVGTTHYFSPEGGYGETGRLTEGNGGVDGNGVPTGHSGKYPVVSYDTIVTGGKATTQDPQLNVPFNQDGKSNWATFPATVSADGKRVMPTSEGMKQLEQCTQFQACDAKTQATIRTNFSKGVVNPGLLPTLKKK